MRPYLSLREPSDAVANRLLDAQRDAPVTYADVGLTLDPARRQREVVRDLPTPFGATRDALAGWKQYDLGWTRVAEPRPQVVEGERVAVIARTFGLWTINTCRLVRVIEEPGRFAYAIGTLPCHSESGEELFELTEADGGDGGCRLRIASASGPNHPLVRLGWPAAEWVIRRFLRQAPGALESNASRPE